MIDKDKLSRALGMLGAGLSSKRASSRLLMPKTTLDRWLARLRAHGGDLDAACVPRKMGRPRKTPPSAL